MLRDYQQQLLNDIHTAYDHGARAVCAQMPTGSGKSVVLRQAVKEHQGYSCTIAHRQELVSQLSMHLATVGVVHRIVAPVNVIRTIAKEHQEEFGRSYLSDGSITFVASSQTLASRAKAGKIEPWWHQITFTAHDEFHHVLRNNQFGRAVDLFPNARMLGVTATPYRTDKQGLGSHADGYADALVTGPTMRELIDHGHLSDYEIMLPTGDFDRSRLVIGSTGDFTQASLRKEAERSHIVGDVVQTWLCAASDKQTIVFATDIDTAQEIAKGFKQWNIAAECVSSRTGEYERFSAIRRFRDRHLQVLVNVALFDEGFDVPGVDCVVMARPTQSLGMYLQSCGRALRPSPGKTHALIIDHVSNVKEHGLPDAPRAWSLASERKKRNGDTGIPISTCENCFRDYERSHRACPYCGHEKLPMQRNGPEAVDGDLELLDRDTLAALRASIQLEAPASVAQRVERVAGTLAARGALNRQVERIGTQEQLAHAIAVWAGHGRAAGASDSDLYRRFYHSYGADVVSALGMKTAQMKELMERLQQ